MDIQFASDHVDDAGGVEVGDDLPKHLRFDPTRRAKSKRFRDATWALAKWLTERERDLGLRQRSRTEAEERKFKLAVEALSANLLASHLRGLDGYLNVPRQHATMSGRYASEVYGRHFPDLLDLMAHPEVALVSKEATGFNVKGGPKQASTIRTLPALSDHLPLEDASWDDLTQDPTSTEVLILKGTKDKAGKAPLLPYEETAKIIKLRKGVQSLNVALQRGRIEVVGQWKGWRPDPTDRMVRRYFNNGSWEQGGRLFGGFWMTMPREVRFELVRIDGKPTVNVDYEQLFLCLAYAQDLKAPPEGDLYDIDGHPEHRKGWKKVVNAELFARRPLTTWPRDTQQLFTGKPRFKEIRRLLHERHGAIAHRFGTGLGFELMHTESKMLLYALDGMRRRGITALPLHDAVLVGEGHGEAAKSIMEQAVRLHTGISRAMVKIEKS